MLLRNSYSSLVSLHISVSGSPSLLPHLTLHASALTSLNMSGSGVKDDELQPFLEARGSELRVLSLCGCNVPDKMTINIF